MDLLGGKKKDQTCLVAVFPIYPQSRKVHAIELRLKHRLQRSTVRPECRSTAFDEDTHHSAADSKNGSKDDWKVQLSKSALTGLWNPTTLNISRRTCSQKTTLRNGDELQIPRAGRKWRRLARGGPSQTRLQEEISQRIRPGIHNQNTVCVFVQMKNHGGDQQIVIFGAIWIFHHWDQVSEASVMVTDDP